MPKRDLQPAALAIVRIALRLCGWEPIVETTKDIVTIVQTLVPKPNSPTPSTSVVNEAISWARQSLESLLSTEFDDVPQTDFDAAVYSVGSVLASQEINHLIVQAAIDSSMLEAHLIKHGAKRVRADLGSEGAQAVFDKVLHLCCRHLAEICLSSPEFGPLALRQLLKSHQRLMAITEQLLDTVQGSSQARVDLAFSTFTSRYLTRIAEQFDYLDLPGLDLDRYRRRYNLTAAYVPLSVMGASSTQFTSIQRLLDMQRFLLVAGDPGSGKSTLVKWIAVQLSKACLQEPGEYPIPIIVKLRSLEEIPDLEDIAGASARGIVVRKPVEWARDIVESGNCILLFDGLDEAPEPRRDELVQWISDIYQEHGRRGLRIVVTSRPPAVAEARFRPAEAAYATLEPMPYGSIERFVRVWHQTVFDATTAGDGDVWIDSSARLQATLEHDTHLARLASTPLLCAVICALYYARNEHLPGGRSELYRALLAMLLARRDAERPGFDATHSLSDIERLAKDIAIAFLLRGIDELPRAEVIAVLRASLRGFRNARIRDIGPGPILDYFVMRTGVVRELPPDSRIDFWHKSFQEYLAANAIVDNGDDALLLEMCANESWHEVVVWAASFMPMRRASNLIAGILDAGQKADASERRYLIRLALACAHYCLQLADEVEERVRMAAASLLPPASSIEVLDLASIGDAVVPFLAESLRSASADTADWAVAVLCRIGGDAANTALAGLRPELKAQHAAMLAEAWKLTGSEDYARRVLGTVPTAESNILTVNVDSYRQLRGARYISSIYRVSIDLTGDVFDEDALGSSSSRYIWRATLRGFEWWQVSAFLRRYSAVRELILIDPVGAAVTDDIDDVDQDDLVSAGDAIILGPRFGPDGADESFVYDALRSLSITSSQFVSVDLFTVGLFPAVEIIDISGFVDVVDPQGGGFGSAVRDVSIVVADQCVIDIDWRGGHLERLVVNPWRERSVKALWSLRELQELRISESPELLSLEGLGELREIVTLDVSYCERLSEIEEVYNSPNLELLVVVGCDGILITDLLRPHNFAVDAGEDDLGLLDQDSPTPELLPGRWLYWPLAELSDAELELRGWNDWSFWEQIRGDADEWEVAEARDEEEKAAEERGMTIYSSFDAWWKRQIRRSRVQRSRNLADRAGP
jgi:hypothetical protein